MLVFRGVISIRKNPDPSYGNTRPSVHDTPGAEKKTGGNLTTPADIPWSLWGRIIIMPTVADTTKDSHWLQLFLVQQFLGSQFKKLWEF